jgi:hypothetical protein
MCNRFAHEQLKTYVYVYSDGLFLARVILGRGHLEDFIIADESWSIRYIVIDTRNWWPGKKVLLSPRRIEKVSWADSTVYVDLTRDAIKNAPEYDGSSSIDREYEARLHEHYGRQGYWFYRPA